MKFIKDTLITFTAQITTTMLGMVGSIVIARILGPEGKGIYSLVVLIPTLLTLLGNLGIGIANVYFGGSRKYCWHELASNSLISALGLGTLLSTAFMACYFILRPSFLCEIEPKYVLIPTLMLPVILLTTHAHRAQPIMKIDLVKVFLSATLELSGTKVGSVLTV